MSFNIHQFIECIVKQQLPALAEKNPYFGAGILAGGIEFMGACLDNFPIDDEGKSAARFCQGINELFPNQYHQYSRQTPYTKAQKPLHDLYSSLRCGMAHVLKPQGVVLTGSLKEAAAYGYSHLQIINKDGKDYPLIVFEQFKLDFIDAATELEKRLALNPIPQKLEGIILNVWD